MIQGKKKTPAPFADKTTALLPFCEDMAKERVWKDEYDSPLQCLLHKGSQDQSSADYVHQFKYENKQKKDR